MKLILYHSIQIQFVIDMAVQKIASDTLDFILASCKASHPREFGALLEADGDTIVNVIYLPGTDSTSRSVSFKTWMMPNMPHAGSVHSHPSGAVRPSEQDLIFFRTNEVNIIVGEPYTRESWKAFDKGGNLTALEVVDYEFDDDEFGDDGHDEDDIDGRFDDEDGF
ncbi:hypothetical protein MmiEs2_05740 [Methanimicrococcus stummii]|uniref:MPN domain-containing protein n=1 Tax=Methanimicrococcus stummii TaxID=3028294 RepID=A0AA96V7Z0_9EURY|nr:Mov34/MPN/PAD-1 family protein [Methanimicrococcus sp. Es2]WNY28389.1 hypothetical protein MmiEs2_05740 [Methanimicrococcus sp. Es2]